MKTYHPSHIFYNWSNLLRSYATRGTLLHSLHHFVQASSAFGGSTLTPRRGAFRWTCERVSRFFSYHFYSYSLSIYLPLVYNNILRDPPFFRPHSFPQPNTWLFTTSFLLLCPFLYVPLLIDIQCFSYHLVLLLNDTVFIELLSVCSEIEEFQSNIFIQK